MKMRYLSLLIADISLETGLVPFAEGAPAIADYLVSAIVLMALVTHWSARSF
jgi:hypothetical protein